MSLARLEHLQRAITSDMHWLATAYVINPTWPAFFLTKGRRRGNNTKSYHLFYDVECRETSVSERMDRLSNIRLMKSLAFLYNWTSTGSKNSDVNLTCRVATVSLHTEAHISKRDHLEFWYFWKLETVKSIQSLISRPQVEWNENKNE